MFTFLKSKQYHCIMKPVGLCFCDFRCKNNENLHYNTLLMNKYSYIFAAFIVLVQKETWLKRYFPEFKIMESTIFVCKNMFMFSTSFFCPFKNQRILLSSQARKVFDKKTDKNATTESFGCLFLTFSHDSIRFSQRQILIYWSETEIPSQSNNFWTE